VAITLCGPLLWQCPCPRALLYTKLEVHNDYTSSWIWVLNYYIILMWWEKLSFAISQCLLGFLFVVTYIAWLNLATPILCGLVFFCRRPTEIWWDVLRTLKPTLVIGRVNINFLFFSCVFKRLKVKTNFVCNTLVICKCNMPITIIGHVLPWTYQAQ
jgi:hypothetical protein